ncbi:hypothetical protein J2S00_002495 [Caldalkalibacillus uzonensis]|uniref:Phage ABA sandwich domain-containing protein n=1 Tax=Caldalkalibacillus uzonensis TaxID=353224 RepID=A0ABU0CUA5_9BACI|nr:hypothetical protein [Caldalkalibacillus uzonensis]MDQ0339702.1 hypothetical protein [Caldalkalibacillus uzonensis]
MALFDEIWALANKYPFKTTKTEPKPEENSNVVYLPLSQQDKQAKQAGFVIGIPGEIYFATVRRAIGYEMTVYMERQDTSWLVWRETYTKGKPTASKDIYKGTSFTTALQKATRYIQAVRR